MIDPDIVELWSICRQNPFFADFAASPALTRPLGLLDFQNQIWNIKSRSARGGRRWEDLPAKDLTDARARGHARVLATRRGHRRSKPAIDWPGGGAPTRTYTTIADPGVCSGSDKGFLTQINDERPFRLSACADHTKTYRGGYRATWSIACFAGSRAQLLCRLVEQRKLTAEERAILEKS